MVVKGEYHTLDDTSRKTNGYVFMDYITGAMMYHFTNLVIGINIQLQTITRRRSHKVHYLLPHLEHERLMETINNIEDPYGLLE